jgi:hypothetical protein
VSKLVLKSFLTYETNACQYAFPYGTTLHGACIEKSVYLWLAHPPSIKKWHANFGLAGFMKKDTLPPYFHDRIIIYASWNLPSPAAPWETAEEMQLRLTKEDKFS